MFCPIRGWCVTIFFYYLDKSDFIREVCNTDEHKNCLQYINNQDVEKIRPKECLCSQCRNADCLRHPFSCREGRIVGVYKNCLCNQCQTDERCFPLIALGDEKNFIESLSPKRFQKMVELFEELKIRGSPYRQLGGDFTLPLKTLMEACEAKLKTK